MTCVQSLIGSQPLIIGQCVFVGINSFWQQVLSQTFRVEGPQIHMRGRQWNTRIMCQDSFVMSLYCTNRVICSVSLENIDDSWNGNRCISHKTSVSFQDLFVDIAVMDSRERWLNRVKSSVNSREFRIPYALVRMSTWKTLASMLVSIDLKFQESASRIEQWTAYCEESKLILLYSIVNRWLFHEKETIISIAIMLALVMVTMLCSRWRLHT